MQSKQILHLPSTGRGDLIVGLTRELAKEEPTAGQFIGLISYVNIFNSALDSSVISWMSHGCGENLLNAIVPWSQFIDGFVGDIKVQRPALCTDNEGEWEDSSIAERHHNEYCEHNTEGGVCVRGWGGGGERVG